MTALFMEYGREGHSLVSVEKGACAACGKEEGAYYRLQYRYVVLMGFFGSISDRRYSCICKACRASTPVTRAEVESVTKVDKLPLHRKYGIYALAPLAIWMVHAYFTGLR